MANEIVAPPLDIDLNTVDTSMPLIADGSIADLQIKKVELKNTSTPGVQMLAIDFATTSPTKAQDGADLGAGIHVFHNLVLVPSGKGTWDMVARNVGALVQNAGVQVPGSSFAEQLQNLTANYVALLQGAQVRAKLKVQPEGVDKKTGKSFRAKNEVSVFMKVS